MIRYFDHSIYQVIAFVVFLSVASGHDECHHEVIGMEPATSGVADSVDIDGTHGVEGAFQMVWMQTKGVHIDGGVSKGKDTLVVAQHLPLHIVAHKGEFFFGNKIRTESFTLAAHLVCHRFALVGRALEHPADGRVNPVRVQHITRRGYLVSQSDLEGRMMESMGMKSQKERLGEAFARKGVSILTKTRENSAISLTMNARKAGGRKI